MNPPQPVLDLPTSSSDTSMATSTPPAFDSIAEIGKAGFELEADCGSQSALQEQPLLFDHNGGEGVQNLQNEDELPVSDAAVAEKPTFHPFRRLAVELRLMVSN